MEDGGLKAVLRLMRENKNSDELQWCCLDASASFLSGDAAARTEFMREGGLESLLQAMERSVYVDEVQSRGCWCIAALAADHAIELGNSGVHACMRALRCCPESFQVVIAVVRALTNLVCSAPPAGPMIIQQILRAGGVALLEERLESSGEGQLAWKGEKLLSIIKEAILEPPLPNSEGSALLALERRQQSTGFASTEPFELGVGVDFMKPPYLGGAIGESIVRAGEEGGILSVVNALRDAIEGMGDEISLVEGVEISSLLSQRNNSGEKAYWCCDWLLGALRDGGNGCAEVAVESGMVPLMGSLLARSWHDEKMSVLILELLATLVTEHSLLIGKAFIPPIVQHLSAVRTCPLLLLAGVKLLASLLQEPSQKNISIARDADAVTAVKDVVSSVPLNPQLQYRVIVSKAMCRSRVCASGVKA